MVIFLNSELYNKILTTSLIRVLQNKLDAFTITRAYTNGQVINFISGCLLYLIYDTTVSSDMQAADFYY